MEIWFEWDPVKAASNERKHGVSFLLARRVFTDGFAVTEPDFHEQGDQRWRTIGEVDGRLILIVIHIDREYPDGDQLIRIISARPATKAERNTYDRGRYGSH